jgi:hypothetical protein
LNIYPDPSILLNLNKGTIISGGTRKKNLAEPLRKTIIDILNRKIILHIKKPIYNTSQSKAQEMPMLRKKEQTQNMLNEVHKEKRKA